MIIWSRYLHTVTKLETFPAIVSIASEIRMSYDTYHFYGKTRRDKQHGLFKYTLEGEGCFEDASGIHKIKKGQGFLCNVCDPETGYYYPKDGTEPWRFVYIAFNGSSPINIVKDICLKYGTVFDISEDDDVIRTLMSFSGKAEKQELITPSEALSLVVKTLSGLVRSKEQGVKHYPENNIIKEFQQLIEKHIDKNINVSEIASMMDISREHISRIFREHLRTSPRDFLQNYKMRLACHMLKESNMSIKEIAYNLGYDQPGNFIRTFKRYIKLSPKKYRQSGDISFLT